MNPLHGTHLVATRALLGDLVFNQTTTSAVCQTLQLPEEMVTNHNGLKVSKKLLHKWLKYYYEKNETNGFSYYCDEVLELYVYISENGLLGAFDNVLRLADERRWKSIKYEMLEVQSRFIAMGLFKHKE